MRARAVVFDLDGTLVDSMPQHHRAYERVLAPLGLAPAPLDVYLLEGKKSSEVIAILAERAGRPLPPEEARRLGEEKQRTFRTFGVPKPYPGALEALEDLAKRGYLLGLATGTNRENVHHMLGPAISRFGAVVTGDEVGRTKPDPEAYLRAFETLGVPPASGIVVENAPFGVEAGLRSGARVLAVTHTLPAARLASAHAVAADLAGAVARIVEESA